MNRPHEPQDPAYYRYWLGRIAEHVSLRTTTYQTKAGEIHISIARGLENLGYAERAADDRRELVLTNAGIDRLAELTGEAPAHRPYAVRRYDLAGFDIIGVRQTDGRLRLGSGTLVDAFPAEVDLLDLTWTLEAVRENEGETDEQRAICWGVYC